MKVIQVKWAGASSIEKEVAIIKKGFIYSIKTLMNSFIKVNVTVH